MLYIFTWLAINRFSFSFKLNPILSFSLSFSLSLSLTLSYSFSLGFVKWNYFNLFSSIFLSDRWDCHRHHLLAFVFLTFLCFVFQSAMYTRQLKFNLLILLPAHISQYDKQKKRVRQHISKKLAMHSSKKVEIYLWMNKWMKRLRDIFSMSFSVGFNELGSYQVKVKFSLILTLFQTH